jgi:hypothetical protein
MFDREDVAQELARVFRATDNALIGGALTQMNSDAAEIERLNQRYSALVSAVRGYQNMPGYSVHPMVNAQINTSEREQS